MIDITHKITTLRSATAQAIVKVSSDTTIEAIKNKTVPKGDVLEMAKAAGLLGVKKTADLIPDCHPIPIESATISYAIKDLEVTIFAEVKTVYKTGVEVEAMHAASVVALTMYDMLKPIDKQVEVHSIRLLEKNGGKSDFTSSAKQPLRAAILVCSDAVKSGKKQDKAGQLIAEKIKACKVDVASYHITGDDKSVISSMVKEQAQHHDLVILTGGTAVSPTDTTTEAVAPLLDREIPGIMEAARNYGQQRTPYSMLSRGIAGVIGDTLVLAMPGSTNGARQTMDALFPSLLHIFRMLKM